MMVSFSPVDAAEIHVSASHQADINSASLVVMLTSGLETVSIYLTLHQAMKLGVALTDAIREAEERRSHEQG